MNQLKKFVSELSKREKIWNGLKVVLILVAVGSLFIKGSGFDQSSDFSYYLSVSIFIVVMLLLLTGFGFIFYKLLKRLALKQLISNYLSAISLVALFSFFVQLLIVLDYFSKVTWVYILEFLFWLATMILMPAIILMSLVIFGLGGLFSPDAFHLEAFNENFLAFSLIGFLLLTDIIFWFFIILAIKAIYKQIKKKLKKK